MRTASSLVILTLFVAVTPASAQQGAALDARWNAWLGCWQQLEETVEEDLLDPRTKVTPTRGVVVCVTPAPAGPGVTLSTIVEQQFALEETIVADGTSRSTDEPGCTGSQRAEWSKNGRRLFARAELSCTDKTTRTVSAMAMMAPGPVWVDIQVAQSDGRESIRVRRYRRSPDQSHVKSQLTAEQLSRAAVAAAQQAKAFTLDELVEASGKVSPSALEAALVETQSRFPLNAKRLVALDAAGVPDRVLDLMIAASFPNKFVVERRVTAPAVMPIASWIDPAWMDLGYGIFPYYYAPFGYSSWYRYDYRFWGGSLYYVDFQSGGSVAGVGQQRASGEGRVVDGMGYTRVRSRDPIPANADGGSTASSGGTSSTSGGSSSGSGVSSQGYSGGGGDSGRTAVARPPN